MLPLLSLFFLIGFTLVAAKTGDQQFLLALEIWLSSFLFEALIPGSVFFFHSPC